MEFCPSQMKWDWALLDIRSILFDILNIAISSQSIKTIKAEHSLTHTEKQS